MKFSSPLQPAPDSSYNETDIHLEVTPDRRSLTSTVSTASSEGQVAGDYQDMETDGAVLKNRQFVYKEMVATEQDYIKDLSTVIDVSYAYCKSEERKGEIMIDDNSLL